MTNSNHQRYGLQVFDPSGALVLEVGPYVVAGSPEFAEKIGAIAAAWSQAEVNLNCLFGVLLGTTPEEAARELARYRTASEVTRKVRAVAGEVIQGPDFDSLNTLLGQLDHVRERRNRLQHDVWASKPSESSRLYAIHARDYLDLAMRLVAVQTTAGTTGSEEAVERSMAFVESVSCGYSIAELAELETAIHSVSTALLRTMFQCLGLPVERS